MITAHYQATDEIVIIVGGNSGIGTALTSQLLQSGARVISIDIQDALDKKVAQCREEQSVTYFQADPKSRGELGRIAELVEKEESPVVGLVNLSGAITYFGSIENASADDWNDTYNISFQSCLHSCQVFAPILRHSSRGAIVNMSSGLAFIGQHNYGPYSAAKAAIVSLTKTLAVELAPTIRVNSVAPGAVDTGFIYKDDGSTRFDLDGYKARVPLGNVARPSEIASVIMYLLSDGASHITGECIHVNGGVG